MKITPYSAYSTLGFLFLTLRDTSPSYSNSSTSSPKRAVEVSIRQISPYVSSTQKKFAQWLITVREYGSTSATVYILISK